MCTLRPQPPQQHQVPLAGVEAELQLRGGFLPLMHLFPDEQHHPGLSIPWTAADRELHAWAHTSPTYQAAIADWTP